MMGKMSIDHWQSDGDGGVVVGGGGKSEEWKIQSSERRSYTGGGWTLKGQLELIVV